MNGQLLIETRASGSVRNYASQTRSADYVTNRTGSPGKFTFSMIKGHQANFAMGDPVLFYANNVKIFAGRIFKSSLNRWGELEVTAYDQKRYLLAENSYAFYNATLPEVIRKIGTDFELNFGVLENPGYIVPAYVRENKTCLDIIEYLVQLNTKNTGKVYTFYDDFGALSLREAGSLMVPQVIGSESLITDYIYTADIDSDTYNRIKLVRPNEETGRTDVYVFQDSNTISSWGVLQYYEQVDEEMNPAQIEEQGRTMLAYYNRVLQTLDIESLGVLGLNAGMMVMVKIPDIPDISSSQFVLLDKAEHHFENETHTMKLQTRTLLK